MSERRAAPFAGYRVEHDLPGGPVRVVAQTTIQSIAIQTALRWRNQLRQTGTMGSVRVVAVATGDVLHQYAIDPADAR
jgi:hypothetical protein